MSRPILVTGMPRCGTSWVGKMLDASGEVVYVNEPLNTDHPPGRSPGILRAHVDARFQYISEENEEDFLDAFRDTIGLRYHAWDEIKENRSAYDLLRLVKYWSSFVRGRLRGRRALIDDPFAAFSAEWFARRLRCHVVVVVRHPAAIVNSRRRLGHRTDFTQLLRQPALVRDWLEPFREELEGMVRAPDDLVGHGALLWRVVYHVLDEQGKRNREYRLVRHEDLSREPVPAFAALYDSLGLPFTEGVEKEIVRSTSGTRNGASHPWSLSRRGLSRTGFRPLDSRAAADTWRGELPAHDIARVRALTADVAPRYYPDDEWA